jgi:hypothetical protein
MGEKYDRKVSVALEKVAAEVGAKSIQYLESVVAFDVGFELADCTVTLLNDIDHISFFGIAPIISALLRLIVNNIWSGFLLRIILSLTELNL